MTFWQDVMEQTRARNRSLRFKLRGAFVRSGIACFVIALLVDHWVARVFWGAIGLWEWWDAFMVERTAWDETGANDG